MWQDITYGVCNILFALAILPVIFSNAKPPLSTSAITSASLCIFAFTSYSLNLYFAAAIQVVTAVLWGTLAVQKLRSAKLKI